jgi:Ca2+-binding RTX toxin-like protein
MAIITGSTSSQTHVGTADDDTIHGGGGNDFIDGGAGTDTVVFSGNRSTFNFVNLSGAVRVTGLSTAPAAYVGDTARIFNVEKVQFANLTETVPATGNNQIGGTTSSQTHNGTAGNDVIDGAGGNDLINGGAGTDTVVFFGNRSDFNYVNLSGAVRVTGLSTAPAAYVGDTARIFNVEKVQFANLTETVPATGNNQIGGTTSSQTHNGTAGNDVIDGAGGNDLINGGAGTDTVVFFGNRSDFNYVNLSGAVRVTGLSTAPAAYVGDTARIFNVEKVQFANLTETVPATGNNQIGGTTSSQTHNGTVGNDVIDGAGGNDLINGGAGTDTVVFFGNRSDFNYVNLSGAVRVTGLSTAPVDYLGDTARIFNAEKVQFANLTETVPATGNNQIGGTTSSQTHNGTAGNDVIDGAGGNDLINGGAGTDTVVFFGNRSDFNYVNLSGVVRVTGLSTAPADYLGDTARIFNAEKVQFANLTETVPATGNNQIGGTTSSQTHNGTAGNDVIDGAGGNDLINGGAGTDTVVFFGNRNDFNYVNLSGVVRVTGLSTAPADYLGDTARIFNAEKVQFANLTETVPATGNNQIGGPLAVRPTTELLGMM